jgi:arylsulfatase
MLGHRAIWQDGWVAVTYHERGVPFHEDQWELYNVNQDFSQKNNLAEKYPEKLQELQEIWWQEAKKYGVLPLNDSPYRKGYEGLQEGRTTFIFYPGMAHLPTSAAPKVTLSSYSMTIPIFRADRTEEGVLIAHGNHSSGYTLYIKDNYLFYEYNYVGTIYQIQSSVEVPVGYSTIRFDFKKEKFIQGTGILSINGQQVGTIFMPRTLPFVISVEGMDIGRDRLTSVSANYSVPEFPFSGQLEKVIIELHDNRPDSKNPIYININGRIIII